MTYRTLRWTRKGAAPIVVAYRPAPACDPPDACLAAMTCSVHFCGCWYYRNPWQCDCNDESEG